MDWEPIIAIIAIIFGILVIAFEGLLRWLVGLFFIVLGIWYAIQWVQKRGK